MRAPDLVALAAVATCLVEIPTASADPCSTRQPEPSAPVRAPLGPADFGMVPEACPATSLTLQATAAVLIATADFYGTLTAGLALRGRVVLPGNVWVSLWAPGLEYRFAADATVEAGSTDLSAGTLGVHVPLRVSERLGIAPYGRALLPTETVFQRATRYGVEHGISAKYTLATAFDLVGGYAFPLLLTDSGTAALSVFAPTVALDLAYHPWRALSITGGVALRVVPADPDPFESFDPRLSVRLYPWRGALVEIAGVAPLWGRDRTDAAISGALGWVASP